MMKDKQVFIPRDSLVKVYFKNGTVIEGVVLTWSDEKGLLRSPGCSNRMIIYNPAENVMMVKLLLSEEVDLKESTDEEELPIPKTALKVEQVKSNHYDEPLEVSSTDPIDERTRKLAQYRLSRVTSDKKMFAKTLESTEHTTDVSLDFSKQPPKVETEYYESPNFSQHRIGFNSRKKSH